MAGGDHCPLPTACRINIRHVQQFKSHLIPRTRRLLQADAVLIPRPYVLSRASTWHGITYTLHVSPPRDGGPRAIPVVLKGPLMSFFNLVSVHLKLARVGHLLHAGERPGPPRCPLSVVLLHVIRHKDPR
jgi:hypothetical protein